MNDNFQENIDKLIYKESSYEIKNILMTLGKNPKRPLGKISPWSWWVEIVRGCNLRCGFCATTLFPKNEFHFMEEKIFINLLNLIKTMTPFNRLEFGNAGEPTLHPKLLDFFRLSKEIIPKTQTMVITNGTTLVDGRVKYKDLFEAGVNIVLVDMYAPREVHLKLAMESGYMFYEKDRFIPKGSPKVWTYNNDPNLKLIALQNNPEDWLSKKVNSGRLSTFFNNLNWEKAKKYNLKPIISPPNRRCDLPTKFINVYYDGSYTFCCWDFMRQVAGKLGNVSEGADGFFKFWLGEYMQYTRRLLHNKDRKNHQFCSKCAFTSIRCDIPYWKPEMYEKYWDGDKWNIVNDSKFDFVREEIIKEEDQRRDGFLF